MSDLCIRINGIVLDAEQIEELESTYGVAAELGDYWYDTHCGLFGPLGGPAAGFMYPEHDYGVLARDASGGDTNVLINGRELTQDEWVLLSQTVGTMVLPGAYWLDWQGNAGLEGSEIPLVNLMVVAPQRMGGAGGDDFWSSRFSAGNCDAGKTCGYVSVPGVGPVGYGF